MDVGTGHRYSRKTARRHATGGFRCSENRVDLFVDGGILQIEIFGSCRRLPRSRTT